MTAPTSRPKRPTQQEAEGIVVPKIQKLSDSAADPTGRCIIYIDDKKISSGHLTHLKTVAKRKGFTLADSISNEVTHVVSALPPNDRTSDILTSKYPPSSEFVTLEWLTNSFVEGKPTQVTDRYRLFKHTHQLSPPTPVDQKDDTSFQLPDYECQRPTPLNHHNHRLTDALELLERYYEYVDHKEGDTRGLAFRRASCVLKSLPREVTHVDQVAGLRGIGKHSAQVIEELIATGSSREVEEHRSSEWFRCMEVFTSIYGCGPATAGKWYKRGLRTVEDVRACTELELTEMQRMGIQYYEQLLCPIPRYENTLITGFIRREVEKCFPGTSVEAVGGFRRGKPFSHDIDILLTHPDSSTVAIMLETLLDHLKTKGCLIHVDVSIGQNTGTQLQSGAHKADHTPHGRRSTSKFDHLDKSLCIMYFDERHFEQGVSISALPLIRRVDLIVSPQEQYPFALISWTGSKQFNRSLRLYATKELKMAVTAHGVYDMTQRKLVPANTEQEVFLNLSLPYFEPTDRNC